MKKCNDGEHHWIVIAWVKGTYNEGEFIPGNMGWNNPSYRASHFMCQRCLTGKTMDEMERSHLAMQHPANK